MGKGTRVHQNITAQKYLKELGVRSCSNLIFWHPRSTLADVTESRRALEQLSHLDKLSTIRFVLVAGSPLYYGLSLEDRQCLEPALKDSIPEAIRAFAFRFGHIPPERMALDRETDAAWQELEDWYGSVKVEYGSRARELSVARIAPDRLRILDSRFDELQEHILAGAEAAIHDVLPFRPATRSASPPSRASARRRWRRGWPRWWNASCFTTAKGSTSRWPCALAMN